jgi:hypothetical protein
MAPVRALPEISCSRCCMQVRPKISNAEPTQSLPQAAAFWFRINVQCMWGLDRIEYFPVHYA